MMRLDWFSWLPTLLCLLIAAYTVGTTPTPYVVIFVVAALALSIRGAITANFNIYGWSSGCTLAACILSLMEKRPVAWFEPALMGLGVICFIGVAHIDSVFSGKTVSPELMECYDNTPRAYEEDNTAQLQPSTLDNTPDLRRLLSLSALRAAAIALASLAFSCVFFAFAGAGPKKLEEAFFMMLLGVTVIGVSTYWFIRLAAPDAYRQPHR